jgi:hypothetical protein
MIWVHDVKKKEKEKIQKRLQVIIESIEDSAMSEKV